MIGRLARAESPFLLIAMIALATVTAPMVEELIFRAGFFRFCRTRLPRWAALLAPACLFAALHQNLATFAPLVALGIVFSWPTSTPVELAPPWSPTDFSTPTRSRSS
jgi:membrane protease YdiL (CAAX protease family)